MYITSIPNRNSPPAILLRESYREGKRVKKRTIANLSSLTLEQAEMIRLVLKGRKVGEIGVLDDVRTTVEDYDATRDRIREVLEDLRDQQNGYKGNSAGRADDDQTEAGFLLEGSHETAP